jgi:hypothetical protein
MSKISNTCLDNGRHLVEYFRFEQYDEGAVERVRDCVSYILSWIFR